MKKHINVGVAGFGYWGPNLVRNFKSLPGCNLKMICDVDVGRLAALQKMYPDIAAENRYEQMLGSAVDAVVVATPVKHHFSMAKAALEAGKHVLVEKPMAATSVQCEELIDIAHKNGLILMAGHTFLYSPAVRKIKEIMDHGDLGQIRYICARRLNLGLCQKEINAAWDLAPHDISIVLHLLGQQPTTVNCSGRSCTTPGIEDVTGMFLNFANDCSAVIHSSWLHPRKVREMTIVGSKRMLLYDDVAAQEKITLFDIRVDRLERQDKLAEFKFEYHQGDASSPRLTQEEPLKAECSHFLECIREGKTPQSCGLRGLEVVRILEAASISLRLRGSAIPVTAPKSAPVSDDLTVGEIANTDWQSWPAPIAASRSALLEFSGLKHEAVPCVG
ncbi:MAG TPA: Gfo/Idh/MocA family oxidoreductase [Verrucomicrobiae bacterium]|jgi:predicted dehydrogenase